MVGSEGSGGTLRAVANLRIGRDGIERTDDLLNKQSQGLPTFRHRNHTSKRI